MSQNIKNYDVIIIGGGYTSLPPSFFNHSSAVMFSKLFQSLILLTANVKKPNRNLLKNESGLNLRRSSGLVSL